MVGENEWQISNSKTTDFTDVDMISIPKSSSVDENNPPNRNDFGLAIGAKLSDVDKFRFLTEFYTPPASYAWPAATRVDRGKSITCRLNRSELLKYPCFAYSPKLWGVLYIFCIVCNKRSWPK